MEYRRLGSSGCKVSVLGLGTWLTFGQRLDDRSASAIVKRALDLGINFIDTADVYEGGRAEEQLGRILPAVPRKDYVLATKCFFPTGDGPNDRGLSRKHVDESLHASLRRLGVDYVDLLQCHRYDPETPVYETVRAFDDLIRQGKVVYWGVSVWSAEQIREAVDVARDLGAPPPVTNQPPYNLLDRSIEAEVVPACREHGLGILPFSPLAQGVLTGKYLEDATPHGSRRADPRRNQFMGRYLEPESVARVERLAALAKEAGLTPAQLSLAWLLRRPGVSSVIVGVTKVSQLEDDAGAVGAEVDGAVFERLDEIFERTD